MSLLRLSTIQDIEGCLVITGKKEVHFTTIFIGERDKESDELIAEAGKLIFTGVTHKEKGSQQSYIPRALLFFEAYGR